MSGGGAVVLLSGGIDSAVALYWARGEGHRLWTLEIQYHERPRREKQAAEALAAQAGAQRIVVDMPSVREAAVEGAPPGYIPAKNLLFYSMAAHQAEIVGASMLVGGHNHQDADRFPDARRSFFDGLESLFAQGLC
jgi:7-cyano-7-deazaguanine synthase